MEKLKIKQAIIVEGKYDKNKVSQIFDTIVIQTDGFSVFNSSEIQNYIKKLSEEVGIIILTDSDSAGMLIRNRIKSFVDEEKILNAYIPQIEGKEKRKEKSSKEGFLGVEGVSNDTIIKAVLDVTSEQKGSVSKIQYSDLYEMGYIGRENSKSLRESLLKDLNLPPYLNNSDLLKYINSNEEVLKWLYKNQEKCTLKQY